MPLLSRFTYMFFLSLSLSLSLCTGKPVMIITEYMENGSLDAFLRVSFVYVLQVFKAHLFDSAVI